MSRRGGGGSGNGSRAAVALLLFLLLLLGAGLRLALVLTADRPGTPYEWNDEGSYARLAGNLAGGHGFSASRSEPYRPALFRTPGYPLFLAPVFLLGEPDLRAGLVAGALADTLTALLLFLLVRLLLGSLAPALVAAAAWTFLSPFLGLLDYLYPGPAAGAFVALAALLTAWCHLRGGAWRGLAAGAAWGWVILVRPFFLPGALAALLPVRRRAWPLLAAGLLLVLAPWTVRNALVSGEFILLARGGVGMNLWVGTWNPRGAFIEIENQEDGGGTLSFPEGWADSDEEARRAVEQWNRYMTAFLGEGGPEIEDADRALGGLARERILRHPGRWLWVRARNNAWTWSQPQMPGGRVTGLSLLVLAAAGALRLWRHGRRRTVLLLVLPLLATAAALAPLASAPRYVAPLAPLFFALAAALLGPPPGSEPGGDADGPGGMQEADFQGERREDTPGSG